MSQTKAQLLGPVLGDVNYDSGTLVIDSTNNRVGIGVTNPTQTLDIRGSLYLQNNGTTNTDILTSYVPGLNNLAKCMLGIGRFPTTNQSLRIEFLYNNTGNSSSSFHIFGDAFGTALTVQKGGNVGVGTSNSAAKLDIRGDNIRHQGTNPYIEFYQTNNTNTGYIQSRTTDFRFNSVGTIPVTFGTNDTERVRIDANGNIGIGTTNPTEKLEVNGNLQSTDLYITEDYPDIIPSLDLVFDKSKVLDSRITFTRNSTATYVDKNGIIQIAEVNEPRFDHDPVTGESLGLIIEEQRTNLLRRSAEFDNTGGWTSNSNATATPSIISPDGTTTGYLITNSNSVPYSGFFQNLTVQSNTTYTLSVYQKGYEYTTTRFGIFSYNDSTWYAFTEYGWDNGTPTLFTISGISDNKTASITDVGGGWYRTTITFTTGVETNCKVEFHPDRSGTGLSSYFWGIQLELGRFATSYIPTTSSEATRNTDIAEITGTNFSEWFNPTEGTTLLSYDKYYQQTQFDIPVYPAVFSIGAWPTRITYFDMGGPYQEIYVNLNGVIQTNLNIGGSSRPINTELKMVGAYKKNDFAAVGSERVLYTDNSGVIPSGFSSAYIGNEAFGNILNGHIRRITYYPRRLNNSQLQNISL